MRGQMEVVASMEEAKGDDVRAKAKPRSNKYSYACALVASTISVLLGYDTGVMSGAMIFIKEDLHIDDTEVEVLAGILNVCALVGSLPAGRISDWIGRRWTITVASAIFLLGSVLMGVAPSYPMLITGRCVAGVGVGFALMIAPVYSAEISSPTTRGLITSITEVCISAGILLGYVSNYGLSKLPLKYGWRAMLGIGAAPSMALAVGILAMPESPRWLIMQGRLHESRKVLMSISDTVEDADLRFKEIKQAAGIPENCMDQAATPPTGHRGKGAWRELLLRPSPAVKRILMAALGLHFFEHAVGIEAVVLYSPRIFKIAGVRTNNQLLLATVAVGFTKTCFILVASFLLDRVGRRPLLLTSAAGILASLAALGSGLTIHATKDVGWALGLSIVSVFTYIAFFSIGLGPITWVYSTEIFPLRLRAQGASLGVAMNRLMNGVVSMSFISLYKAITIGGAFFMFSGISALAWLFFYFFLPETKGRSLEDMEVIFDGNANAKRYREVEVSSLPPHRLHHASEMV